MGPLVPLPPPEQGGVAQRPQQREAGRRVRRSPPRLLQRRGLRATPQFTTGVRALGPTKLPPREVLRAFEPFRALTAGAPYRRGGWHSKRRRSKSAGTEAPMSKFSRLLAQASKFPPGQKGPFLPPKGPLRGREEFCDHKLCTSSPTKKALQVSENPFVSPSPRSLLFCSRRALWARRVLSGQKGPLGPEGPFRA